MADQLDHRQYVPYHSARVYKIHLEYMIAAPLSMPRRATHQPDVSPVVGRCAHGWLHPGELDLAAQQGQARSVSSRAGGALSTLPRKWAASRRRKKSTRNLLGGRWQGPAQQLDGRCKAIRGWLEMVCNRPLRCSTQFLALPTPQLSPSFFHLSDILILRCWRK